MGGWHSEDLLTRLNRGNPNLQPETVLSFDLSAEYYFAPSSLVSLGVFHKVRDNLFASVTESPPDNAVDGVVNRSRDPSCPGGGIYNPIAIISVNNPARGQTGPGREAPPLRRWGARACGA